MTPEDAATQVANELWDELKTVIVKRFGNQLSETELQIVAGAVAGIAGFYLSPLPREAVMIFAKDVMRYHQASRERGASSVVSQLMS